MDLVQYSPDYKPLKAQIIFFFVCDMKPYIPEVKRKGFDFPTSLDSNFSSPG